MKHAKKLLLIIAAMILVMTTGVNVALGEPTPTATPAATPSPSDSATTETTETGTPGTETSATSTFTLLELNSTGENVIRLQMRLRDLGYFNYRPTGMYFGMTQKAVMSFQEQNELSPDGQAGEITYNDMFTIDAVRKPLGASVIPAVGPGALVTPVYGELSSWDEINAIFTVGMKVTVTDINTGLAFEMTRTGGENHADVESASTESYDKFVDSFGDESNWSEKRAVLVTINGTNYAASLFAHPSGEDTISDNGMAGHTQIYFNGSTSDIFGFTDRYHQDKVLAASGQTP